VKYSKHQAQSPANVTPAEPVPPTPKVEPKAAEPRVKFTAAGIELSHPMIELRYSLFVSRSHAVNTSKVTPKRAIIVGGAIVIEELDLILPLSETIIRTGEPIP